MAYFIVQQYFCATVSQVIGVTVAQVIGVKPRNLCSHYTKLCIVTKHREILSSSLVMLKTFSTKYQI